MLIDLIVVGASFFAVVVVKRYRFRTIFNFVQRINSRDPPAYEKIRCSCSLANQSRLGGYKNRSLIKVREKKEGQCYVGRPRVRDHRRRLKPRASLFSSFTSSLIFVTEVVFST